MVCVVFSIDTASLNCDIHQSLRKLLFLSADLPSTLFTGGKEIGIISKIFRRQKRTDYPSFF